MRSTTRSVVETIFFAKTTRTISTLRRMREESGSHFPILLKTVVMQHNLQHICRIAAFAAEQQLEVLYQPIGDHSIRIAKRGFQCVGADISESIMNKARDNARKTWLET